QPERLPNLRRFSTHWHGVQGAELREPEVLRQHADDHERLIAKRDGPANDVRVCSKTPPPEAVTEHDDATLTGASLFVEDRPPTLRAHAKHPEQAGRHAAGVQPFRLARPGEVHVDLAQQSQILERARRLAPPLEVGGIHRKPREASVSQDFVYRDETVRS